MSNSPFKDRFDIKDRIIGGSQAGTVVSPLDNTTVEPPEEESLIDPFIDRFGIAYKVVSGSASGSVSLPFSTANHVSATISRFDSGSDLSSTDHIRQGVEITTSRHRFNRVLPILGSGKDDHTLDQTEFGFPKNIEKIDGSLEPLTIRDIVLGKSTFEIEPHSFKGQLQDGNSDEWGRSNIITQFYAKTPISQSVKPYIDSTELFGNSNTGSIKIPGIISDYDPIIEPFDETAFDRFLSSSVNGPFSKLIISMSLGRSGSHRNFGIIADKDKSATAGFIYDSTTTVGLDSLTFGDTQKYQRIGFQRELDNITGSYPTKVRTGDKDRKGKFKIKFDDTKTIVFDTNQFIDVQRNLHSASIYLHKPFLSQTIDPGRKPRFYPFLGQTVIERATSASLYASGTVRKGVADAQIRFDYNGGDDLSPFVEDFIYEDKSDPFWKTGSRIEDVGIGFFSPVLDKTKIEIDLTPNDETYLSSSWSKPNYTMGYFNFKNKKWQGIGTGESVINSNNASSVKTTGERLTYGFNVSYYDNTTINDQYATWQQSGMPISSFGFPIHAKFHATSSQLYHMSQSISHPFLLEKIVYEFSASIGSPTASFTEQGHVATFFMLNQRENFHLSQSFPIVKLGAPNVGVGISASIPATINLSSGGEKIKISSVRDLISFSNVAVFNSSATALEMEAKAGDLNIVGNATGSFVLSGTIKSPSRAEAMGVFDNGTIGLVVSNRLGGRNSIGTPTGRDFVNSVVGFKLSGSSVSIGGTTIFPNATRFINNPYILFPEDTLVFGWQVPFHYKNHVNNILFKEGNITFHKNKGRLIFYGSLIKNLKEFHDTLNQPLTSKTISEIIGDDPVLDQYDTEYFQMFSGSYIDDYITGSMSNNTRLHRQILGSIFGQNNIESGSFSRMVQLNSVSERFYDSLIPDPVQISFANNSRPIYNSTIDLNEIVLNANGVIGTATPPITDADWPRAFPFEQKYRLIKRETGAPSRITVNKDTAGNTIDSTIRKYVLIRGSGSANVILSGDESLGSNISPSKEIFLKHYFGIGDSDFYTGSVEFERKSGTTAFGVKNQRGWKYGLHSALDSFTKTYWNRSHFGQIRDLLEQKLDTKFFDAQTNSILTSPIQIFFSGSEPYQTDSSNKSFEATSSIPYFDNQSFN